MVNFPSPLNPITHIDPITFQRFERYLPTAFNDELTILQKLNKLIKAVNDLEEGTNGIIDQWNEIIVWLQANGLYDMVNEILNNWLLDGTLFSQISTVNVLIFGADNKGTRVTAADIQKGIDFIQTKGGGTLYFPAGTYLIEKKLILCDNITIQMDDGATLKRAWGGGFFMNKDWDAAGANSSLKGAGNITIIGGTLDGNYNGRGQYPADTCDMMVFAYADNFDIRNVTFKDVLSYHALDLNGLKNVLIENCQFKGYSNIINTPVYRESIQIGEAQIFLDDTDNYTPCENVTVRKCYFGPSENCGAPDVGVGNHYSRYNKFNTHITIEDNQFENCGQMAVRPYKWVDVNISNNTFKNCKVGIQISNPSGGIESSKDMFGSQTNLPQSGYDYLIDGNSFIDFKDYGIYSAGQYYNNVLSRPVNIRISDNTFTGTNSGNQENNAISLIYWQDVKIKGNNFKDVKRGVVLTGCKFVDYDFNKHENMFAEAVATLTSDIASSAADGYYVDQLNVRSNEINGCQKNGIYLLRAKAFKIDNNDIVNPAQLSDGTNRGGVYAQDCISGRVTNNYTTGTPAFNVNVNSGSDSITCFNNSGNGQVQILGTNCQNGFYGIDGSGNIVFKAQ